MAHCTICELNLNSVEQLAQHKTGKTHLKNLAIRNGDIPAPGLGTAKPASSTTSLSSKYVIGTPTQHIMFVKAGLMSEEEAVQAKETVKRQAGELDQDLNQFKNSVDGEGIRKRTSPNYCDYCKKHLNSPSQSSQHYLSDKHKKRVRMVEGSSVATDTTFTADGMCTAQMANAGLVSSSVPGYNTTGFHTSLDCPAPPLPPASCFPNIHTIPVPPHLQQSFVAAGNHPQAVASSFQPAQAPNVASGIQSGLLFCNFCNMSLNSVSQISAHRAGAKHKKNVAKLHGQAIVSSTTFN